MFIKEDIKKYIELSNGINPITHMDTAYAFSAQMADVFNIIERWDLRVSDIIISVLLRSFLEDKLNTYLEYNEDFEESFMLKYFGTDILWGARFHYSNDCPIDKIIFLDLEYILDTENKDSTRGIALFTM